MNDEFRTINKHATTELIIQKSRFLCQAIPVENEEEALSFLHTIKKKHWNATHNCYAYCITPMIQKASDDGEPSGTAGRPILGVINKNHLRHTLVVITRYFGGVKLGAGGLIRAYSQGTSEVITQAGILTRSLHVELTLTFDYAYLSKVESELRKIPHHIDPIHFDEKITCTLWVHANVVENVKKKAIDWTHGNVEIQVGCKMLKNNKTN